jgi:hypothetical protein
MYELKQRHTDSVCQRAAARAISPRGNKKGLRQYNTFRPQWHRRMSLSPFQQYNTLNFQHAGQTSHMQMCVYSPGLRDSAAKSLYLESETFFSNVDICNISRPIRPNFLPEKCP